MLINISAESEVEDLTQTRHQLYKGPEKSYRAMWNVTGRSKADCIQHCEQEVTCDVVKVNQVTENGRKECLLLANSFGSDKNVNTTDLYEKN